MFNRMEQQGQKYYINSIKPFNGSQTMGWEMVQVAYDFAYNMTFGNKGKHRDHRSGGKHIRKPGEIFKDTFQGKLSECALYNVLNQRHIITEPNFEVWKLGEWDLDDFLIDDKRASVKSTKSIGNLLMLETKDFGANGVYLPNVARGGGEYDYYVLVRMNPFCEEIMKKNCLLYAASADYNQLKDIIINQKWTYDVPGYITKEDFKNIISDRFIIPEGAILNDRTPIDADNYYVQAGDLRPIESL